MKKLGVLVMFALAAGLLVNVDSADARPNYKKAFDTKYEVKNGGLADAKCNVCHYGDSKKNRNAYGMALGKLLKNEKDDETIVKALDEVGKMPSAGDGSPSFGDLIKEGKLPAKAPE